MAKPRKISGVDSFMAETVSYGGMPVSRLTALRLASEAMEEKHAQFFVFGCLKEATGTQMTYDEVKTECGDFLAA